MEEHVQAKKRAWEPLTRTLGSPRHPRRQSSTSSGAGRDAATSPSTASSPGSASAASKFHDWKDPLRQGQRAQRLVPRDRWLDRPDEKPAILDFHARPSPRRLSPAAFMMLDADVVARRARPASIACSRRRDCWPAQRPSLTKGHRLRAAPASPTSTGTSMSATSTSPARSTILCSILDGCSRFIVHWEIRENMKEADVETIMQRAREGIPASAPRIITDNGPQFIAKDFKEFIRICGMTHVKTRPTIRSATARSNAGTTIKAECIRVKRPAHRRQCATGGRAILQPRPLAQCDRLRRAADKLAGREWRIIAELSRKRGTARERRKAARGPVGAGRRHAA